MDKLTPPLEYSEIYPRTIFMLEALAAGDLETKEFVYYRGDFPKDIKRCDYNENLPFAGEAKKYKALLRRIRDKAAQLQKNGDLVLSNRIAKKYNKKGEHVDTHTEYVAAPARNLEKQTVPDDLATA